MASSFEPNSSPANVRRLKDSSGPLTTAALKRLETELSWYRKLPAAEKSWVGLVAQQGIGQFIQWLTNPDPSNMAAGEMFASAPPDLTRSISLQHTLQIVRIAV